MTQQLSPAQRAQIIDYVFEGLSIERVRGAYRNDFGGSVNHHIQNMPDYDVREAVVDKVLAENGLKFKQEKYYLNSVKTHSFTHEEVESWLSAVAFD